MLTFVFLKNTNRTKFNRSGWQGVEDEIQLDLKRIWQRNLGRDDRIIADWGRELRTPFLDERVARALARLTLSSICNVEAGREGVGEKHLLRRCARRVGLFSASLLDKRAIQFGTRAAQTYKRVARQNGQQQRRRAQGTENVVSLQKK